MIKRTGDTFYFGIDESNHGVFPEVFVAVGSYNYTDSRVFPNSRKINEENILFSSMRTRDYRFSVLTKKDYERFHHKDIMPRVAGKLINSFEEDYDFLDVSVDGSLRQCQKDLLESLVDKGSELEGKILIKDLPKGEDYSTNYLVSLADGWSRFIVKKLKKGEITAGMKRRYVEF